MVYAACAITLDAFTQFADAKVGIFFDMTKFFHYYLYKQK